MLEINKNKTNKDKKLKEKELNSIGIDNISEQSRALEIINLVK